MSGVCENRYLHATSLCSSVYTLSLPLFLHTVTQWTCVQLTSIHNTLQTHSSKNIHENSFERLDSSAAATGNTLSAHTTRHRPCVLTAKRVLTILFGFGSLSLSLSALQKKKREKLSIFHDFLLRITLGPKISVSFPRHSRKLPLND